MTGPATFSISFVEGSERLEDGEFHCMDLVVKFGREVTQFTTPLSYWPLRRYEMQWIDGLERIMERGEPASCLMTSVIPLGVEGVTCLIELHRSGTVIWASERYVLNYHLPDAYDPDNDVYGILGPAVVEAERVDGQIVRVRGEPVSISAVAECLAGLRASTSREPTSETWRGPSTGDAHDSGH